MSQETRSSSRILNAPQNMDKVSKSNTSHSFEITENSQMNNDSSESTNNEENANIKDSIISEEKIKDDSNQTEGGEWEILINKISRWWQKGEFYKSWGRLLSITFIVSAIVILFIILALYNGVLDALGKLPLTPKILELIGLYSALKFASLSLIRADSRREFFSLVKKKVNSYNQPPNQKQKI